MSAYIKGMGNISPQKTWDENGLLNQPLAYMGDKLSCHEPDYSKFIDIKQLRRMSRIIKMGVAAGSMALKQAGMKQNDIDLIELNEAFASQALAVTRELNLNPDIINVNGGAIALGHPLGCTGAKLSVQLFEEMRLRKSKYGIVSMCVGTGQGTAGIYELL